MEIQLGRFYAKAVSHKHNNYENDPNVAASGRRFWCRISRG
jgi:hypothetical protein